MAVWSTESGPVGGLEEDKEMLKNTESGPMGGLEEDEEMLKKSADFFELTI
eukprot:gene13021-3529_t